MLVLMLGYVRGRRGGVIVSGFELVAVERQNPYTTAPSWKRSDDTKLVLSRSPRDRAVAIPTPHKRSMRGRTKDYSRYHIGLGRKLFHVRVCGWRAFLCLAVMVGIGGSCGNPLRSLVFVVAS